MLSIIVYVMGTKNLLEDWKRRYSDKYDTKRIDRI